MPSLLFTNSTLTLAVKKHAKVDIKLFLSCPVLLDFSILFQIFSTGLSEWTKYLVVAQPGLLETLVFGQFEHYQSISAIFKENLKQINCVKIANLTVSCNIQFRTKPDYRKLSPPLMGRFLTGLTFLNQVSIFSRNWNHHAKCREQKKKFSDNLGCNILELCNGVIQTGLATSKTKGDN